MQHPVTVWADDREIQSGIPVVLARSPISLIGTRWCDSMKPSPMSHTDKLKPHTLHVFRGTAWRL